MALGPVVPEVYHSYKGYGGGTVLTQKKPSTAISETDQEIIIMMMEECQTYSNVELEEESPKGKLHGSRHIRQEKIR